MAAGRGQRQLIDLPCMLRHETQAAYLLDFGETEPEWIPKSMCQYHREGKNEIVTMEEWFAKKKGLI
ncbi:MAG: hypothetical protein KGL35_25015 [Bradyrhizobium sp.]|nr:hypothetical protein [Bradyrhizobium sp.]